MHIIQALIFVFAALFGNVDSTPTQAADNGPGQERYLWCDVDPDRPHCQNIDY